MSDKTLTKNDYQQLQNDIEKLIQEGKKKALEATRSQMVKTYWLIGQRINEESLSNNANYQSSILEQLATELSLTKDTLLRSLQFFNSYQEMPTTNLSWSHYRELITVKDETLRLQLEEKAADENWNRQRLVNEKLNLQNTTYSDISNQEKTITRPTAPTYLYKAKVSNVVDGDTLLLAIDLGFDVFKEQRVRLSQINTPELKTPKGQEAKNYVLEQLAKVEFVMVKTNKIDIYGRFLGDIFYDPTNNKSKDKVFLEGIYLNEELVRVGLAEIV